MRAVFTMWRAQRLARCSCWGWRRTQWRRPTPCGQRPRKRPRSPPLRSRMGTCASSCCSTRPFRPASSSRTPASVANAKAQVAAARDAIVTWHFGSATSPTQGQGFDRGLDPLPDHAGICRQRIAVGAAGARQRRARDPHQLRPRLADEPHRQRAADRHDGRLYAGRDRRGPGRCRARYRRQVRPRVPHRQGGGGGVLLQCLPRRQPGQPVPQWNAIANGRGRRQRRRPPPASTAPANLCQHGTPRRRHRRRLEHQPARRRAAERSGQEREDLRHPDLHALQ